MKRLYRSRHDRVLGGVAAGMAEYFEVDPTLVRLAWVLAALAGIGILGYIVAWIIIPEASSEASTQTPPQAGAAPEGLAPESVPGLDDFDRHRHRERSARFIGIALVVFGGWMLLNRIFPHFLLDRLWPLLLVILGAYLLIGASKR